MNYLTFVLHKKSYITQSGFAAFLYNGSFFETYSYSGRANLSLYMFLFFSYSAFSASLRSLR